MRFISLASSSKANCYVVEHGGQALLVDAGLRKRDMLARLREVDLKPEQIVAILVSHHHSDHAGRAGEISAALHIPVYCSNETLEAAPASLLSKAEKVLTFQPGNDLFIENFGIHPVTTYHTPGAVGFWIACDGNKVSIFTDVAELAGGVADAMERSNLVAIEADYSVPLLEACEYDPELKRRIRLAHTSNERLAEFFSNGFRGEALHSVVLLHLSKVANVPFVAVQTVGDALRKWVTFKASAGREVKVTAASSEQVTGPIEV